ncbi:hypothetical protein HOY80DRAFT_959544 [Tuber brumale]|nr:hypothetical protein HOY80DRAFT_959544 [Tuber brumale]
MVGKQVEMMVERLSDNRHRGLCIDTLVTIVVVVVFKNLTSGWPISAAIVIRLVGWAPTTAGAFWRQSSRHSFSKLSLDRNEIPKQRSKGG